MTVPFEYFQCRNVVLNTGWSKFLAQDNPGLKGELSGLPVFDIKNAGEKRRDQTETDKVWNKGKKDSEIPVLSQPVCLRREVPVDNIAFVVLEAPGSDDQDIPFPDPDTFFDLALNPAHPGNPVITPDPDMICPHHQVRECKLFVCPFFG